MKHPLEKVSIFALKVKKLHNGDTDFSGLRFRYPSSDSCRWQYLRDSDTDFPQLISHKDVDSAFSHFSRLKPWREQRHSYWSFYTRLKVHRREILTPLCWHNLTYEMRLVGCVHFLEIFFHKTWRWWDFYTLGADRVRVQWEFPAVRVNAEWNKPI